MGAVLLTRFIVYPASSHRLTINNHFRYHCIKAPHLSPEFDQDILNLSGSSLRDLFPGYFYDYISDFCDQMVRVYFKCTSNSPPIQYFIRKCIPGCTTTS